MKKGILMFFLLCSSIILLAETDSASEIKKLTDRVTALENLLFWVKVLGLPLFGLTSIWAIYMWFKGIKAKVDKIIEEDANKKIEEKTQSLVQKTLLTYPFIQDFEQVQIIKKEKHILIVGPTPKDMALIEQMEKMGFKQIQSVAIDQAKNTDISKIHLVLLDNRSGLLTQGQMDSIAEHFQKQAYFFYFSAEGGPRWESNLKDLGRMGFANSLGRLEQNIVDQFKNIG